MRRSRLLAMLMLGALVFAACGGDDDDGVVPSAESDDDSSDDASDDESEDESSDDSDDESSETESEDDGDDPDIDIDEDDLDDLTDLDNDCVQASLAMVAAMGGAFTGEGGDTEESLEQFEELADNAPDDIKDDLQTIAEGLGKYYEELADAGFDPDSGEVPDASDIAALTELAESLNTEEMQEAGDNVNEWFEAGCP
jgi:hypothetical protein